MDDRPPDSGLAPKPGPGDRPAKASTSARLRAGRAGLVAGMAIIMAIAVPPVGIVLGLLAVTMAVRAARAPGSGQGLMAGAAGLAGTAAVLVGIALSVVLALFWTELRTYYDCSAGANTRQAEQRCDTELSDVLDERLGFTILR